MGCGVRYPPLLTGAGQSGCNRKNSPEAKRGVWVEEAANAADPEIAKCEFRKDNWRSPQTGDQKQAQRIGEEVSRGTRASSNQATVTLCGRVSYVLEVGYVKPRDGAKIFTCVRTWNKIQIEHASLR